MWLQLINKVKVTYQGQVQIKVIFSTSDYSDELLLSKVTILENFRSGPDPHGSGSDSEALIG